QSGESSSRERSIPSIFVSSTELIMPTRSMRVPPPPENLGPADPKWNRIRTEHNWNHVDLHRSVYEALFALPGYFKSDLNINAVLATDLYTFNSALGATIENQIVDALNELRE